MRTAEEAKVWGRRRWSDDDNRRINKGLCRRMTNSANALCLFSLALTVVGRLLKGRMAINRGRAGDRAV